MFSFRSDNLETNRGSIRHSMPNAWLAYSADLSFALLFCCDERRELLGCIRVRALSLAAAAAVTSLFFAMLFFVFREFLLGRFRVGFGMLRRMAIVYDLILSGRQVCASVF